MRGRKTRALVYAKHLQCHGVETAEWHLEEPTGHKGPGHGRDRQVRMVSAHALSRGACQVRERPPRNNGATVVRTRAAGWTAARSRRSRRKTLLCTARSEREKGRSKVSKKSLKQLLENGREMT